MKVVLTIYRDGDDEEPIAVTEADTLRDRLTPTQALERVITNATDLMLTIYVSSPPSA